MASISTTTRRCFKEERRRTNFAACCSIGSRKDIGALQELVFLEISEKQPSPELVKAAKHWMGLANPDNWEIS